MDREKPPGVEVENRIHRAGGEDTGRPVRLELNDNRPERDPREALRAERWLAEENRVIAEVGRIVTSELQIDQIYERFAEEVGRLIPFDRLAIGLTNALIDIPENTNKVAYSSGLAAHRQQGDVVLLEGSVVSAAIHSGSTQLFSTEYEDEVARLFPGNLPAFRAGIRTLLAVPLVHGDQVIGSLNFTSTSVDAYVAKHVRMAKNVAAQIAGAIANALLYARLEETDRELQAMAEIGRILSSSLDIDEVYEGFAQEVRKLVSFDRLAISLTGGLADVEEGYYRRVYATGLMEYRPQGEVVSLEGSVIEAASRAGSPVLFTADTEEEVAKHYPGNLNLFRSGIRTFLNAPLTFKGQVIGTLNFSSTTSGAYSNREVGLAQRLTAQISGVVANAQLHRQVLEASNALEQNALELERSNSDLAEFAYVASHDLQTPLRSIVGFSKFLSKEYGDQLDEDGQDYIRRLSNAAGRMKTLIDDLLAYSRVGREVSEEETDCQAMFADELETLQLTMEEAGAVVTHDALPKLRMDSSLFRQVIRNLTGNAIKYRGEEPPRIHVSARRGSGEWVFSVRDNGIGIDPQYSERIFGVFQRLHSRDEYSGTGIGLAICKKAAQRLGGRIWVESEIGRGSVFYFTVPHNEDGGQLTRTAEDAGRQIA